MADSTVAKFHYFKLVDLRRDPAAGRRLPAVWLVTLQLEFAASTGLVVPNRLRLEVPIPAEV
jgi:hypothetical protein